MKVRKCEIPELWLTAFPNYKGRTFHKCENHMYNLKSFYEIDEGVRLQREVALIDTFTGVITRPSLYDSDRWVRIESDMVVAEHLFSGSRDYGIYFTLDSTLIRDW